MHIMGLGIRFIPKHKHGSVFGGLILQLIGYVGFILMQATPNAVDERNPRCWAQIVTLKVGRAGLWGVAPRHVAKCMLAADGVSSHAAKSRTVAMKRVAR